MAFLFGHFDVGDYDQWKQGFDSDPAGPQASRQGAHGLPQCR